MKVYKRHDISSTPMGVRMDLTLTEARDLYLDLSRVHAYQSSTVEVRDALKPLLGIQNCSVFPGGDRQDPCTNDGIIAARVSCFNHHNRTRRYCAKHLKELQDGRLRCMICTDEGDWKYAVFLGQEK